MCRIITTTELKARTETELSALFRAVSSHLAESEPGSEQARSARASLQNISHELSTRRPTGPKPPRL